MKRMKDECYYDYQARRAMTKENYKATKGGRLLHCSAVMINKGTVLKPVWEKLKVQGTYNNPYRIDGKRHKPIG